MSRPSGRAAGVRRALLVPLAALLGACSDDRPAKLVGDAYLVMATGREVNLANQEVHLVEEQEELDSAIAKICRATGMGAAQAGRSDEAWRMRAQLLNGLVRRSTRTDQAARFAMDSIPPGRYRLWADAAVDDERWTWLHPLRIRAGDSLRVNLSNGNMDDDPFRCQ